jgi:hypothetical protein
MENTKVYYNKPPKQGRNGKWKQNDKSFILKVPPKGVDVLVL